MKHVKDPLAKQLFKPEPLDYEVVKAQLGKKRGKRFQRSTLDELNRLRMDPDYGEVFTEAYIDYFNILDRNSKWTQSMYMHALKFFILVELGDNLKTAYVKVFPERLQVRLARGEPEENINGEASRFNSTPLMAEIRKVSSVGIQLSHRFMLMDALDVTHKMMYSAKSEMVRQKAAETLIRELKPVDNKIELEVSVADSSAVRDLKDALASAAMDQLQHLAVGTTDLNKLGALKPAEEPIDAEVEDA